MTDIGKITGSVSSSLVIIQDLTKDLKTNQTKTLTAGSPLQTYRSTDQTLFCIQHLQQK